MRTTKLRGMNSTLLASLAAAVTALAPGAANAQQESDQPSETSDEIVVTAQRYEQRLQDVPISISVLSADNLAAQGATQLEDVQFSVPGLSSFQNAPGQQFIQLRGVASLVGPATIGQYIDEMPFTTDNTAGAIDIRLLDLARVEVLRGPQPTLYGESSMGGTVHYVTARPDLNEYSSTFEAEAGVVEDGAESYKANAVVNIPLGADVVGLRLVAGHQEDGGWIDNVTTGVDDQNGLVVNTLRGTLLVRPAPNTEISLMALHQELEQENQNLGADRQTTAAALSYSNDDYDLINGVISHDFGGVDLTYSLGYVARDGTASIDLTPFFLGALLAPPPFGLGLPPGFITQIALVSVGDTDIVTHEARLSSQQNDFFNWTLGAYTRESDAESDFSGVTSPGVLGFELLAGASHNRSQSWAVYGDGRFQFTDALSVLVGARYFEDDKDTQSATTSFGFPSTEAASGSFNSLNPRLNIMYEFSPTAMVYFNAAKGFRSGGFNSQASGGGTPVPPTFDPDELWSYEIGTRDQFWNGRALFEAAVYYNDWRDVQSSAFVGASPLTIITNGGDASGWGVDLSATINPVEGLTLAATYGWNNIEYTSDTADKNPGDPIDFAVQQSYSASLDYRRPLFGTTEGFFRADYQHADEAQATLRGFFGDQIIALPARDLVGLRAGVDFGHMEASVFATNALDDDAPVIRGPFGVITENLEQRPRTIGVRLRASY